MENEKMETQEKGGTEKLVNSEDGQQETAEVAKSEVFNEGTLFHGEIRYKTDGTALILQHKGVDGDQKILEAPPVAHDGIKYLSWCSYDNPYSKSSSSSENLSPKAQTSSVQNFLVHHLPDCDVLEEEENQSCNLDEDNQNKNCCDSSGNSEVFFHRLLSSVKNDENAAVRDGSKPRKLIFLCLPCRLTFGLSSSFAAHASGFHQILKTENERKLLNSELISCVIQETKDSKTNLCFLEPVDAERIEGKQNLEKILSSKLADTEEKSVSTAEENDAAESVDDLKMDIEEAEDKLTIDENQDTSDKIVKKSTVTDRSESTAESKTKPIDLSNNTTEKPIVSISGSFTVADSIENVSRSNKTIMATVSENPARSSPLSLPKSGKSSDSLFGGNTGITNVDPLFQMSLFQSRNSCKTLKCPRCNWHYKYRQTLDAHMKEKHADETSDCMYCNANQPHPRLSRGESYACGYKPFKCEVCNYSTTTKGNLSIHMQSDKHLYNVKTIQHQQQQQQEKLNGQTQTGYNDINSASASGSAIPGRLLAEKQEQLQNLIQQQRKRSSPDTSTNPNVISGSLQQQQQQSRKGGREYSASPTTTTSSNRRQPWRCDVCNYETDIPRNLRIHMQSEKHANNMALAGALHGKTGGKPLEDQTPMDDSGSNIGKNGAGDPQTSLDANPSMAALYYYLAMQSSMNPTQLNDPKVNTEERDKQQKQLLAQQQQMLIAQQYQQMLAQLTGSGENSGPSTTLLQQQLILQQQMQLWRQLLAQGDSSQLLSGMPKPNDLDFNFQDVNNPPSTSEEFLFTCGICCNFSCNDLDSLCSHVRAPRVGRNSLDDNEWVTRSPAEGYLCKICNYTTQLKTNFSLHCKTEKHTSKLQLINHIREGGESSEWKVAHAIAGSNLNKVTCNGCRHSSTSIDKLKIHCSTDRHQGTLTMCHYLDRMLKENELSRGLKSTEGMSTHHLFCRPCSYQSKFVVGMIQHMQCQDHQAKVHEVQQSGKYSPTDIVCAEPDPEFKTGEKEEIETGKGDPEPMTAKDTEMTSVGEAEKEVHICQLCKFEASEAEELRTHITSQHGSQSAIKCPMCPDYLKTTNEFQVHLVEVHNLATRVSGTYNAASSQSKETTDVSKMLPHSAIKAEEKVETTFNSMDGTQKQVELHGDTAADAPVQPENPALIKEEKMDVDSNEDDKMRDVFSNPRILLTKLCNDAVFAAKAMRDVQFGQAWDNLTPPFSCCVCEETFVQKRDLLDHLMTSEPHKIHEISQNLGSEGEAHAKRAGELSPRGQFENSPLGGGKDENDDPLPEENSDSKGFSKAAHKKVLADVGFDEVAHFVENRLPENKEKAKMWKKDHEGENQGTTDKNNNLNQLDENKNTDFENGSTTSPSDKNTSPNTCVRCGKEFSNMWILKVHEKSVHNVEMSPEMLEEFVHGYTSWYWDCFKNENEEVKTEQDGSQGDDKPPLPQNFDTSDSTTNSASMPSVQNNDSADDKDFKQTAMQALLKNYPGILPPYGGVQQSGQNQSNADQDSKFQQQQHQQMLLQMLMAAQSPLQQQANSQSPNRGTNTNIMNMLVDHLYGAAVHGAAPGFMDPMGVMALLQQQQQSSLPGPGINPYQWLAMRYLQQQQLQQLLMYPAMAAGNTGLPFMSNLMENNNQQQQMLAALATNLLTPGGAQQDPSVMGNPIANALHAYQLQAAAASVAESMTGSGKDEPDSAKLLRLHQRESVVSTPQHQQSEVPAKRPRTRITDDQLKILRSNFDINTSPSENQIAEMALKTGLPPKVIKHWFRNTLFKERQRSKDSPYNFSIPPMTSLDDVNPDLSRNNDSPIMAKSESRSVERSSPELANDVANAVSRPASMSESDAIQILKSLSEHGKTASDVPSPIFPMSYLPGLPRGAEMESPNASELTQRAALADHKESQHYSVSRASEYPLYSVNTHTCNPATLARRTPRTRFSDYQLKVLQEFFDKNAYPKDEDLDKLSRMLELSTRVIVVWFQNARQKARKSYEMQHANGMPNLVSHARRRPPAFTPPSSPKQKLSPLIKPVENRDSFSTSSLKSEQSDNSSESNAFKCRQCDTTLPTSEALEQHEKLHNPYTTFMQQYRIHYPSIIEGMMQDSHKVERREKSPVGNEDNPQSRTPDSPTSERRRSQENIKHLQPSQHTMEEIMSRFGMQNSVQSGSRSPPSLESKSIRQNTPSNFSQFHNQDFASKRGLVSPPSLTSPTGNRINNNIRRKGINDTSKDPKRLRTTITPEQLEYLYQQYLVDSSPSRKVIEHISDIVGLKKRVVQVWFQNTRARERKGQFRSVGRITSVLGMPQICPHCRVTFRTKADLDAHVRYRHMQSPSAVAQQMATDSLRNSGRPSDFSGPLTSATVSREDSASDSSRDKPFDYPGLFNTINKKRNEQRLAESGSSNEVVVYHQSARSSSSDGHPGSPKRRRTSASDSDQPKPFVSSPPPNKPTDISSKTAEIYRAVTEHIFGTKSNSTVDAIAQRLQGKATSHSPEIETPNNHSFNRDENQVTSSDYENRVSSPSIASSPELHASGSPTYPAPFKRYRTQMTSLQVRCLKHCFSEYKTPTLLECESLGAQIGLQKRVIQVWFQNARAKDKKIRQGDVPMESPFHFNTTCSLCTEMRFGSQQEYRNHIFSKAHLKNFMNNNEGDASDDGGRRTSFSDSDEYAVRDNEQQDRSGVISSVPSRSDDNKFRISAIATSGLASFAERAQSKEAGWDATAYASILASGQQANYQQQLAAMQKLSNSATQNGGDHQQPNTPEKIAVSSAEEALNNLKQSWIKHQQSLNAERMSGKVSGNPFEEISSNSGRTAVHDAE